jgi:hypothetical protein
VLFAAGYGVSLLVNFSAVINAINMDGDVVVAPVIGKLLGSAPHSARVVLGNHGYYEELWFLRATAGLPYYRELWEITPACWSLVGLGLLAWSTWKALGPWAAALAASALLCVGSGARVSLFTFDSHGLALVHTILLGALLVWLVGRAQSLRAWQLAVIAIVAGAASAAPVTGERVFVCWALLPMLVTSALLAWRTHQREHRRVLAVVVAVVVIALVGGHLLWRAMQDIHWYETGFEVFLAPVSSVAGNLSLLTRCYLYLGGGEFAGASLDVEAAARFISGALVLCALVALLLRGFVVLLSRLRRRWSAATPAAVTYDAVQSRRFAYVVFWTSSLAATSAAYVFTTAPVDVTTARYVLPGYVAIGALLPLLAMRSSGWRAIVVAGVCVFSLVACIQIVRQPSGPTTPWPSLRQANEVVRVAREEHVTYGYASYWVAADLTWNSYFKVDIYPVAGCSPRSALCPFELGRISSWYSAQPHTRSMFIADPKESPDANGPGTELGKPVAIKNADGLAVYVYPYDIVKRFGRSSS